MSASLSYIAALLALGTGCAANLYARQVISPSSTKEIYQDQPEEVRDGSFLRAQLSISESSFTLELKTEPRCRAALLGRQLSFARDLYSKKTWPLYPITIVGVVGGGAVAAAFPTSWIAESIGGTAALGPLLGYVFLPNEYWGKTETQTGERAIGKWQGDGHPCRGESPAPLAGEPVDIVASFENSDPSLSWRETTDALGAVAAPDRQVIQRVAFFCGPATITFRIASLAKPPQDSPLSPSNATYPDPTPFAKETGLPGQLEEISDPAARERASQCASRRETLPPALGGADPHTAADVAASAADRERRRS